MAQIAHPTCYQYGNRDSVLENFRLLILSSSFHLSHPLTERPLVLLPIFWYLPSGLPHKGSFAISIIDNLGPCSTPEIWLQQCLLMKEFFLEHNLPSIQLPDLNAFPQDFTFKNGSHHGLSKQERRSIKYFFNPCCFHPFSFPLFQPRASHCLPFSLFYFFRWPFLANMYKYHFLSILSLVDILDGKQKNVCY